MVLFVMILSDGSGIVKCAAMVTKVVTTLLRKFVCKLRINRVHWSHCAMTVCKLVIDHLQLSHLELPVQCPSFLTLSSLASYTIKVAKPVTIS